MEESDDNFKFPEAPPSSSTTPQVAFKMPPPRKLAETSEIIEMQDTENDQTKSQASLKLEKPMEKNEKSGSASTASPSIASGYKPPVWSGPFMTDTYDLDILKDGKIIGNIALSAAGDDPEQSKSFYIFGRQGDIIVEHPSISRYHSVIQYRSIGDPHELGWYLFDMGSTNGVYLNKEKIPPFMYVPVRVGHMFKLGFSTRMYILNGPNEDREPESGMSVTEIKERALKQKMIMEGKRPVITPVKLDEDSEKEINTDEKEMVEQKVAQGTDDQGISWGMTEDYGEEEEEKRNEDEIDTGESIMESIEDIQKREQTYADDPKKALKNFFDRQGCADEMEFEYSEKGSGARHQWTCRIELPIETETGRAVFAEASISGSKKDANTACALEACRILDAAGLLRKSNQDSRKRKSKEWAENDYYDSDEDTFLDRTGEVERKREKRMRQAEADLEMGPSKSVETYDSLSQKLQNVNSEINRGQQQLDLIKAEAARSDDKPPETSAIANKDTLDAYMATMSRRDAQEAKIRQSRLRLKLVELKKQAERLEKLVKIAKPTALPPITVKTLGSDSTTKKQPILIGTMKGHRFRKLVPEPQEPVVEKMDVGQKGNKDDELVEIEEIEDEVKVEKIQEKKKGHESVEMKEPPHAAQKLPSTKVYSALLPESEQSPAGKEGESAETAVQKPKPPKQRPRKNKEKPVVETETSFDDYDPSDINYAVWVPPDDQSGDGRTSLNEKFGY